MSLAGKDTKENKVQLTCLGGVFKRLLFEVTIDNTIREAVPNFGKVHNLLDLLSRTI